MNLILWALAVVGAAALTAGVVAGLVKIVRYRRDSIIKQAKRETLQALGRAGVIHLSYSGTPSPAVYSSEVSTLKYRVEDLEAKNSTKKEKTK